MILGSYPELGWQIVHPNTRICYLAENVNPARPYLILCTWQEIDTQLTPTLLFSGSNHSILTALSPLFLVPLVLPGSISPMAYPKARFLLPFCRHSLNPVLSLSDHVIIMFLLLMPTISHLSISACYRDFGPCSVTLGWGPLLLLNIFRGRPGQVILKIFRHKPLLCQEAYC